MSVLLSTNTFSQPAYTADDFFPKLVHNDATGGHGTAIFELRNPMPSDMPVDSSVLKARIQDAPRATPIRKIWYSILENTSHSENITEYIDSCRTTGTHPSNGSAIMECSFAPSGWHWNNRTFEEWRELSSYIFRAGKTYKIKLEAEWPMKLGLNSREWFPQLVYSGQTYEQSRWAWWNESYNYRYPIILNDTVEDAYAANDNRTLNGTIIWARTANDSYVYSTLAGPSGQMAIANGTQSTGQKFWENETSLAGNSPRKTYSNGTNHSQLWDFHFGDNSSGYYMDSTEYDVWANLTGKPHLNSSGIFGNGVEFRTGQGDYVWPKNNASFMMNKNEFSMGGWVYVTGTTGLASMLSFGWGSAAGGSLVNLYPRGSTGSGASSLAFENIANCNAVGATTPSLNKWYHIMGVYTGAEARIYVNGALEGTNTCQASLEPQHISVKEYRFIGGRYSPSGNANKIYGIMDEVRIYNYTLSSADISRMYYNGLGNYSRLGPEEANSACNGTLSVSLVTPSQNIEIKSGETFMLQANATCTGGCCGTVNAIADPQAVSFVSPLEQKAIGFLQRFSFALGTFLQILLGQGV